jgi:hypothetical protein
LTAVDHPVGTQIFVDERVASPPAPLSVYVTGPSQPFRGARDEQSRDVRAAVAELDGKYLDTFQLGAYQGIAHDHWVELDLPDSAPQRAPVYLIADGWLHPWDDGILVAANQPAAHFALQDLEIEVATPHGGSGLFTDRAGAGPIARASLRDLTFGTFFFDYDLDGWMDIFATNGHLEPDIHKYSPNLEYAQPPLLFHNANGKYEDASKSVGPDFEKPIVGRGAANADFDHDGDLDILINNNDSPAVLFRNDGGNKNNWINVRLVGRKSNRSGLDAIVRVESASGKQWQTVHSGSSYASQSDLALTFGLKQDKAASKITVEWPSGKTQEFSNVAANKFVVIDENAGLSQSR